MTGVQTCALPICFGVLDLGCVLGIGQKREMSRDGGFHPGDAMDLQFAIAREKAPQLIRNLTEFHKTGNHQRSKVAGEVSGAARQANLNAVHLTGRIWESRLLGAREPGSPSAALGVPLRRRVRGFGR